MSSYKYEIRDKFRVVEGKSALRCHKRFGYEMSERMGKQEWIQINGICAYKKSSLRDV